MPDLFYTDPNTLISYSYNPVTRTMTPLQAAAYNTRGYAGVQGLRGSPSGPAVSAPSPSMISNQPIGQRTGLFTPVSGPVGSTITWPSVPTSPGPASYTDPTTLQTYQYIPSTGGLAASGPGYGNPGTVIPQTMQSGTPGSTGPVDRRVDAAPSAPAGPVDRHDTGGNARLYRAQHGLATQDDADALNAESLAAAQAGRTYLNRDLAAQYGQAPASGTYGPRTDVVNALQMPQQQYSQPIMLAQTQQQPVQRYNPYGSQYAGNNLLQQGLY